MSRMYQILQAMKPKFNREDWLVMVEQAKRREKITAEEYQALVEGAV